MSNSVVIDLNQASHDPLEQFIRLTLNHPLILLPSLT